MTPAELRMKIYYALSREPEAETKLVSPVPGEPLALSFVADDPYVRPAGAKRYYRVLIVETDEES